MSAIITEKFRQHNANQFFESFTEAAASVYYLFIGKATPFTSGTTGGNDTIPPTPSDDISSEFYRWDSMIAAKKVASTDVSFALPRVNWINGTVYSMYKDDISASSLSANGATNLFDSNFYFITSAFRVYKILDNNAGASYSGSEPTSESTSPFALGGYVLKYMYTISASDATKFLTTDFMPVKTNASVNAAATDGKIEALSIIGGSGYTDGTFYAAVYGDGTNAGTATGAIVSIKVSGGAIQGFGLASGTDTILHSGGSGYTFGKVNLAAAYIFTDTALTSSGTLGSGSGGSISVVISPKNGHGSDAVAELGGHYVMSNTTLTQAENDDITTANDFREVGLVVDPTVFGSSSVASVNTGRMTYVVKMSTSSGTFDVDETITQATTGAVGRVVEWDASRSLLYYHQERFGSYGTNSTTGAYALFSTTATITGGTSGATGTPSNTASETVTLANSNSLSLTSGYANPELQPDSGNIIYLENRKPIQRSSDQTEDIKIIIEF